MAGKSQTPEAMLDPRSAESKVSEFEVDRVNHTNSSLDMALDRVMSNQVSPEYPTVIIQQSSLDSGSRRISCEVLYPSSLTETRRSSSSDVILSRTKLAHGQARSHFLSSQQNSGHENNCFDHEDGISSSGALTRSDNSPSNRTPAASQPDDQNMGTAQDEPTTPVSIPLPDITGQPDPNGVLLRRLLTYQSFTAPSSQMSLLPPIDASLFSSNRRFHVNYLIKTISTIKCDVCENKCRRNSEVYRCRDCTAQICRECVEDKLGKEQQGIPWTWLGRSHEPFKAAYLLRKEKTVEKFGTGEWIGGVVVDGCTNSLHVTLLIIPKVKTESKKAKPTTRKRSVRESENGSIKNKNNSIVQPLSNTVGEPRKRQRTSKEDNLPTVGTEQRKQIQDQSMRSEYGGKLDRIKNLAQITERSHVTEAVPSPTQQPNLTSKSNSEPASLNTPTDYQIEEQSRLQTTINTTTATTTKNPHPQTSHSVLDTNPPPLPQPTQAYFEGRIVIPPTTTTTTTTIVSNSTSTSTSLSSLHLIPLSINALNIHTNTRVQIPIRNPGISTTIVKQ